MPKLSLFMGSGDLIIIGRGVTVGGGGWKFCFCIFRVVLGISCNN